MAKKEKQFDDMIAAMEEEIVADEATNGHVATLTEKDIQEDNALSLMSNIPPDQGFYYKVYRKHPIPDIHKGQPLFLHQIPQPDLISDLEAEVLKLATQFGWPSGIYEVRLYKTGKPGVEATSTIPIEVSKLVTSPLATSQPQIPSTPPLDPMETMKSAFSMIREMNANTPQQDIPPQTNMVDMMKVVGEMYRANSQTVQPAMNPADMMIAMAALIKELAPPKSEQSGSSLLTVLKEAGAFARPTQLPTVPVIDPIEMMLKIKQMETPREDGMDKSLKQLTAILPLMQQMSGGGSGDSGNTMVEILKILGPQLKDVVSDVTGTINNAIRVKGQLASPRPRQKRPTSATTVEPLPEEQHIPETTQLPVLKAVEDASRANNISFFPELEQLLGGITTTEQMEQLVAGELSPMVVLEQISHLGGNYFKTQEAQMYFQSFLAWMKDKRKEEVIGVCSKCGIEIVYDNLEEHSIDSNCPDCANMVTLVNNEEKNKVIELADNSPSNVEKLPTLPELPVIKDTKEASM